MNELTLMQKKGIVLDDIRRNHPFGIIDLYRGFIVIAHDQKDFDVKIMKINMGDTKGFFTMEREIQRLGL